MALWDSQEVLQTNGRHHQLLAQESAVKKLESTLQVQFCKSADLALIFSILEYTVTPDDLVVIKYSKETHFCLHFFAKEITLEAFRRAEESALKSNDWGEEVRETTKDRF